MSDKAESQKSQKQKFIDKARELGCDEDEEAFRDKLKRIAKTDPKKPSSDQSKARNRKPSASS